jgi:glucan phosphoethanolaminetransferase (alkaline phosphatase superfamily)
MVFYPGGTRSAPGTKGYLFFENFFSELGLSRTYTGGPNNVSFFLFTAALALAGLALTLYFIISPSLFWDSRITRVLSLFGTFFGIISGLSFIGVAFTPADLYLEPHQLFVQLAFTTFFVAVVFYALAILLNRSYPNIYALVNITFGALLGAYIWLLFFGPSTNTSSGLMIQVAGQKIIAYAAIISVFIQAYGSRSMVVIQSEEKRAEKLSNQISTAS